jgi:hypothetical protein
MPQNLRAMACAVAILVIGLSQAGRGPLSGSLVAAPSLIDLRSPDDLKTQFNRDAGKVRLVLLVSPT